jgi:S-DNA-T family DNA segregation ATPase FtsK/SpoIIIE
MDIWRYFRLTWSTPSESTPGRTIKYLIRDAAHPNHAVMGEFERRKELLIKARVENIQRYNENHKEKLAPLVVIIDEFADLTDQLGTKKEKEAFFTPIRQIVQIGRKRGIHLVLCTQRPAADLVPSNIKAQLNARLALRVNDYQSSKMILDETGAQYLQKHGDMIFKDAAGFERLQGYFLRP